MPTTPVRQRHTEQMQNWNIFACLEFFFSLKDDCYQPLLTARIKSPDEHGTKPSDMQVE
ncbi:MAG: hypothetical protein ACR2OA_02615 [Rubripirellula sp.]